MKTETLLLLIVIVGCVDSIVSMYMNKSLFVVLGFISYFVSVCAWFIYIIILFNKTFSEDWHLWHEISIKLQ